MYEDQAARLLQVDRFAHAQLPEILHLSLCLRLVGMKGRGPDNRPSQAELTYLKVSSKVLGSLFSSLNAGTIIVNDLVASLKMDEAGIFTA